MPSRVPVPQPRILGRDPRRRTWPFDPKLRIIPAHSALGGEFVEVRGQVEEFGIGLKRLYAVGASAWNVNRVAVISGNLERAMLQIGRRPWPQVEHDIEKRSTDTADQLVLGVPTELIVEAAQRSRCAADGVVPLREMGVEARRGEFPLAIGAREKPAVVADLVLYDREGAMDRKRGDLHNKWDTVIKAAGIKRMKPRSGRHGFATTALKKMDPKTAAWLGGWKNIRLFMETYAHAIQDITLNERMFDTADTELTQRPTRNARKPRKMGTT